MIRSAPYKHGSWGWDAVDLHSGKTLYAGSADKLTFLGSTAKLFTVGSYLDEFGSTAKLHTPVYAVGSRTGGTLTGNLVLAGAGDFIMGGRGVLSGKLEYTEPDHVYAYAVPTTKPVAADPLAGLDKLAAEVKSSGITSIKGDVLVNDALWHRYQTKEGVVTSIMVNDNLLDVLVTPGAAAGQPVAISTRPSTAYFTVENHAKTTATGGHSTLSAQLGPDNRVLVTGTLPMGSAQQDLAQLAPDPAAYARGLFIEALRRAGVTVQTSVRRANGSMPPSSAFTPSNQVASLASPPAGVLAKLVLKISHNRGAETLMCLMAARAGSKDCESGVSTMINNLAKAGIEPGTVNIYDGEGSDPSAATPAAVVRWLTWVSRQPFAGAIKQGLPDINHDGKALVKSGLSARPENGPVPAMFVVAGQAGYLTTAKGKQVAVAVYAKNATYPTVADGLTKDLPATERVVTDMQRAR